MALTKPAGVSRRMAGSAKAADVPAAAHCQLKWYRRRLNAIITDDARRVDLAIRNNLSVLDGWPPPERQPLLESSR